MELAVAYDFYDLVEDDVDESDYDFHDYLRVIADGVESIDNPYSGDETIQVYNLIMEIREASAGRLFMKDMFAYDIRDVPVMLGSAAFVGAVAGTAWGAATATPSPSVVVLAGCVAGLVAGRILSVKAKERG